MVKPNPRSANHSPFVAAAFDHAVFSIGAEAANAIAVSIQLAFLDNQGAVAIGERAAALAYLSGDANGDSVISSPPSGGVSIGTDGLLIEMGSVAANAQVEENIEFTEFKVHDAMATDLPAVAANDDMGLITGTPGTDGPTLQGVDFGATTSDEKASLEYTLPDDYIPGAAVTVRVRAAMLTTVADTSCTVDVEAWLTDEDGAVGADICATAAQDMNSLTPADLDFTITPTGLVAGDKLIIRVSFAGSDTGNLGVMIPEISKFSILATQRVEVQDAAFRMISEADGDIDISIAETGAKTMYLVVVDPNGRLHVSNAITFV